MAKGVHEFRHSETLRVKQSTQLEAWTKVRNLSRDFDKVSSNKGHSVDAPEEPSRDKPTRQRARRRHLYN